jgi:2-polyprenyl-6-methoxyphenol hydroxylase-like FAD-dependent oxidoreductase
MKLSVAIVGAGMGGLAAAAALRKTGAEVRVYEQASRFARIGAGIQMLPNSMKVLRGLGIEEKLRGFAFAPRSHLNRVWDSGEVQSELPMPESRYNAPYLCMHRGDLHEALLSVVPPDAIFLNKKLLSLTEKNNKTTLEFADGSKTDADLVVGADGVHSRVRELLLGPEKPLNRGRVAYRAVFPAARVGRDLGPSRTKWWGTDRHIVMYYTTKARDEVYFVTSQPERQDWVTPESWSAKGDVNELRAAFAGFHADVRAALDACQDCHKWAILEREPLARWSDGRVVLLGDACHPMTPYMAQGAATSIEDAAILARCLSEFPDIKISLENYEAHRKPRTSRIQAISSANTWMKTQESNPDWLYGYDAWSVPLGDSATAHA